jgi:beta-N-acetylhexosaminidase
MLRERMGFDGLVVTDDLFMTAAAVPGGFPEICVQAVKAGNDILMVSRILEFSEEAWMRLLREYRGDPEFKARVRQSALRVLRAKQAYLKPKGPSGIAPRSERASLLQSRDARTFFTDQAYRSATVLEGAGLPLAPGAARILLAGSFSDFFAEGADRYPGAEAFRFTYQPGPEALEAELESFRARVRGAGAVVVGVANSTGAAFARAAVRMGVPVYLVSVFSPAFALDAGPIVGGVAVYNGSRESYAAAFAVLSGAVEGCGILPISRNP